MQQPSVYVPLHIGCMVEGHGDRDALPILVRRIAREIDPALNLNTDVVQRTTRDSLIRPDTFEGIVEVVGQRLGRPGGILIVIDSEEDCPATLGPQLLQRARAQRGDLHIALALAKPHFEAWFVAAADSLRGHLGLPDDLVSPASPEARNAKRWLEDHKQGEKYSPPKHQAAFARLIDLQLARRADSFDKCYREVAALVTALRREVHGS